MSSPNKEYPAPVSQADADKRRNELVGKQHEIQQQLGNRNRTDATGKRLSEQEYWRWRGNAVHALTCTVAELRFVKQWVREHRGANVPADTLRAAYVLLQNLRSEGVDFDPEELSVLQALEAKLHA